MSEVELLQVFLAERDVACPGCGYNLRGLQGQRCPECGAEVALQVGAPQVRLGVFVAGLVALAAGSGLNGLGALGILVHKLAGYGGTVETQLLVCIWLGLIVQCAALLGWLRASRWLRRQVTPGRVGLALGCWGLTLADGVVFGLMLN